MGLSLIFVLAIAQPLSDPAPLCYVPRTIACCGQVSQYWATECGGQACVGQRRSTGPYQGHTIATEPTEVGHTTLQWNLTANGSTCSYFLCVV
jgi:hypothetical protein